MFQTWSRCIQPQGRFWPWRERYIWFLQVQSKLWICLHYKSNRKIEGENCHVVSVAKCWQVYYYVPLLFIKLFTIYYYLMGAEIKSFVFVLLKNAIILLSKGSKINHNKSFLRDFIHFLNSRASHIFQLLSIKSIRVVKW